MIVQLLPVPPGISRFVRDNGTVGDVHFVGLNSDGTVALISIDPRGIPFEPAKLPDFVSVGDSIAELSAKARAAFDAKPKGP